MSQIEDITPEDSVVPVFLAPLTAEQQAERRQLAKDQAERERADVARDNARQSAVAKLAKLGLTEDEAKAVLSI